MAIGAAGYGYGIQPSSTEPITGGSADRSTTERHVETVAAVGNAVYPSSVTVEESFVEERVFGRVEPRTGHFEEVRKAADAVDGYAKARFGERLVELHSDQRRQLLDSMGVAESHPTPDGTTAERIRFYLINDLLFALFSSPESAHLTGIDNPPGYPGGREAYRVGPRDGGNR